MNLKNKTAIVTGGSRDIGKAVALKLASQGANVVVNYHSDASAGEATVTQIEKEGGRAIAAGGDMTKSGDVRKLIAKTVETFGDRIDILVNNVGGLVARKSLSEMDEDFLNYVMKLNVNSTFLTMQLCLPHMGDGSSVINLASQAGRDGGGPGASAYAASKAAVMTFTRAMAKELGPSNIRVNCICPGMISTTFHDQFTADGVRANVAAGTPLRREGKASEVANLVAYLASPDASFVHGASVDINGGLAFS